MTTERTKGQENGSASRRTAEPPKGRTGEATGGRTAKSAEGQTTEQATEQTNEQAAEQIRDLPGKPVKAPAKGQKGTNKRKGPGKKTKRTKRRHRFLRLLLLVMAASAVGAGIYLFTPSGKKADHREYFGLAEGVSYGLIINQERIGSFPIKRAGYWYLDFETVHTYVSDKFYYDGEQILYTNPTKTFFAAPEAYQYTDDEQLSYKLDYQPCFWENGRLYVALEYLKLTNYSYYLADTEQMYIWIWNNWSELTVAEVKKSGSVRFGSGIKQPVVDTVEAGETLILLEEGTEWDMVQTPRGLIGCIQKRSLKEAGTLTAETPDHRPIPEYTDRLMDETVCMAWHQVFTESGYNQLEDYLEHAEGLNVLSPTWFTIRDNEGNIQSLADPDYVKLAHDRGIQVWGLVEDINIEIDHSQVLGVTKNRRHLVDELIKEAERVDLDGINIDMELVGEANGDHFLQFIREMSAACRKAGLVLSVDNYSPMPHTAFYDREQQAEMVDYVIVMAYDEHYANDDEAGTTSSVGWVKQSAERTLLEVPKEKLIVGLPFYTRLWKETPEAYVEEGERDKMVTNDNSKFGTYLLTSKGISMEACDQIVKERGLSMTWLDEEQQYYVEYEEDHSLYRLWIEDETSLELKLAAAFSYKPAGVAFFKLGLETDDVWLYINKYLNE